MEWAQSFQPEGPISVYNVSSTYRKWFRAAPEEARAWKEQQNFEGDQLEKLNQLEK